MTEFRQAMEGFERADGVPEREKRELGIEVRE